MINYLLLDLDNTLYPRESGLAHHMGRRMGEYVAQHLGVPADRAAVLRREGLARHGTTLRWLMVEHNVTDLDGFMDFVHPVDLGDFLTADDRKTAQRALREVDLPASVLTNGPLEHAHRVLRWLGLESRFEHVFDIRLNKMKGKPHISAYTTALETTGANPSETLFADDVLEYLLPFRDLGGHAFQVGPIPPREPGIGSMPSIGKLAQTVSELRSMG